MAQPRENQPISPAKSSVVRSLCAISVPKKKGRCFFAVGGALCMKWRVLSRGGSEVEVEVGLYVEAPAGVGASPPHELGSEIQIRRFGSFRIRWQFRTGAQLCSRTWPRE